MNDYFYSLISLLGLVYCHDADARVIWTWNIADEENQ